MGWEQDGTARDWRAKNVSVMQGGGASQTVPFEARAEILGAATWADY
jgi:hypothetical protein